MRRGLVLLVLGLSLLFSLVIGEVALRLAFGAGLPGFSDPARYARPFCDDRYHVLRVRDKTEAGIGQLGYEIHATLGWVPGPDSKHAPRREQIENSERPWVAMFGDSFTAGTWGIGAGDFIADQLDERLPNHSVVSYAVSGYGLDQIYLRFEQMLHEVDRAPEIAVFSLMIGDIDRVMERFRDAPKPYYRIESGELVLHGVPITETAQEWIEANDGAPRSFVFDLIGAFVERQIEGRDGYFTECFRDEKEAITRKLLDAIEKRAAEAGVKLLFAIHYPQWDIGATGWRTEFLDREFEDRGLESVNIAAAYLASGISPSKLYYPAPDGHPSALGNRLAAKAIAGALGGDTEETKSSLDAQVDFGRDGNSARYLRTGWGAPEDTGRWTIRKRARIELNPPAHDGALTIDLKLGYILKGLDEVRTLNIRSRGKSLGEWKISQLVTGRTLGVRLSDELADVRPIQLDIEVSDLLRPSEATESRDTRQLGIFVRKLHLRPQRDLRVW